MSFFVGSISGALVAGGVYYGFSNMMSTRTKQHRTDLHVLSTRLIETPTLVEAPPTAASRIRHRPLVSLVQGRWNQEIQTLFSGFHSWDAKVREWGKRMLYGKAVDGYSTAQKQS